MYINKSVNIKCYIDAYSVVHKYMRIHTGVFLNMGTAVAYVHSIK